MQLNTFESNIDSIIVSRGREYHRTGCVGAVEEIAPQLFHASVDGTTRYDVDIRMKGDRVVSAACSCPYDRGPYCKHIVATLMKMRESRHADDTDKNETTARETSTFPHETYDRVLGYLVDKHSKATAARPIREEAKKRRNGKRPEAALSLFAAADEIESGLAEFLQIWDDRWSDRRSGYSYEDNGIAMMGIRRVADNIERCDDDVQACLLALLALGYVINFIGGWDDSDGIAGDEMRRLEMLLAERCDNLAINPRVMLKLQVAHALVAAAENPAYGGWGLQVDFLACAEQLVERYDDARLVLAAVEQHEELTAYDADKLVAVHHKLLVKLGDKKTARQFEKQHALHPYFFLERLEAAFLGHDMQAARELLEQKTGWSQDGDEAKGGVSFTDWGLPHEVFPNGYYTYLEAVFEEQHDRESLLALYRRDVDNGRTGTETRKKLRNLAGDDWPRERDAIIEAAIASGKHSSTAEQLIQEDALADAALRYCQVEFEHPARYSFYGQDRILRFYRLVGESYPDEAREMLRAVIVSKSARASGRDVYREICGVIQRYMSLFGTEEARAIVSELRQKYARRRNLMEELDALEASW